MFSDQEVNHVNHQIENMTSMIVNDNLSFNLVDTFDVSCKIRFYGERCRAQITCVWFQIHVHGIVVFCQTCIVVSLIVALIARTFHFLMH